MERPIQPSNDALATAIAVATYVYQTRDNLGGDADVAAEKIGRLAALILRAAKQEVASTPDAAGESPASEPTLTDSIADYSFNGKTLAEHQASHGQ